MIVGLTIGMDEADDTRMDEERDIFYMMREEMNYIIDELAKIEGFEIA